MKNRFTKGFTLIELLVVIAIIGVLASVVLASLNSARSKGNDSAVKANLANARAQAEIFYDTTSMGDGDYNGVCAAGAGTIRANMDAANNANGGGLADCNENANNSAWAMAAQLSDTATYYCVDSAGASKVVTGPMSTTATGATSWDTDATDAPSVCP